MDKILYKKFENKYFLRIEKDEEIVETLRIFCFKHNIKLATIKGIGAVSSVTFGFFNPKTKIYKEKTFNASMELTSLLGTITQKDNDIYPHLHATVSGYDYQTHGGHFVKAIVSATAEIIIESVEGYIERTFDENIGLNLLDFNK